MLDIEEVKKMKLPQLQEVAAQMGIPRYRYMKKGELQELIAKSFAAPRPEPRPEKTPDISRGDIDAGQVAPRPPSRCKKTTGRENLRGKGNGKTRKPVPTVATKKFLRLPNRLPKALNPR